VQKHSAKLPKVVLTGDFNFPGINWSDDVASNNDCQYFLNILDDFHLSQLVVSPTRYTSHSAAILDLVCTSHPSIITDVEVGREFSNHCLIHFNISASVCTDDKPSRKIYLYNKGDYDRIHADLHQFSQTFLAEMTDSLSVEDIWCKIKRAISRTVNNNVPCKYSTSKRSRPLWLTAKVRSYIRCRDRLAAVAKKVDHILTLTAIAKHVMRHLTC